jgi:hypothetical protein
LQIREIFEEILTLVWHVRGADDPTDLLHSLQIGGEPSVHAEYLFVYDGGDGEAVEALCEGFP